MVWVAPDESARFGEATPIRAVARRSRYVPRRVTSRDRRRASKNRAIRVQGGMVRAATLTLSRRRDVGDGNA